MVEVSGKEKRESRGEETATEERTRAAKRVCLHFILLLEKTKNKCYSTQYRALQNANDFELLLMMLDGVRKLVLPGTTINHKQQSSFRLGNFRFPVIIFLLVWFLFMMMVCIFLYLFAYMHTGTH